MIGWRFGTTGAWVLAVWWMGAAPCQAAEIDLSVAVYTNAMKAWCDPAVPRFKERSQAAYAQWLTRVQGDLAVIQQSPLYAQGLAALTARLEEDYQQHVMLLEPNASVRRELVCNDEFIETFLGGAPLPEPAFATPEATWTRFRDAVGRGDHRTAVSCLAEEARNGYVTALDEAEPREMDAALKKAFQPSPEMVFHPTGPTMGTLGPTTAAEGQLRYGYKRILGSWKIIDFQ